MTIAHPIRKLALTLTLVALAAPAAASAQAHLSIRIGLPAVLPALVVVEPGVQVVQDFGEEVFFVGGYYWARRDEGWYRAHDHRARWTHVEPRRVPTALVRIPAGHYRHWRGEYRRPHRYEEPRYAHWYQEPRYARRYQEHAYRDRHQEHAYRGRHHEQGYPRSRQEHGKAEKRQWHEARSARAGDHGHGHTRGHR